MYPEHENLFDIVIASEVVEHVNDPQTFLYNCCSLIKVWYFFTFCRNWNFRQLQAQFILPNHFLLSKIKVRIQVVCLSGKDNMQGAWVLNPEVIEM